MVIYGDLFMVLTVGKSFIYCDIWCFFFFMVVIVGK